MAQPGQGEFVDFHLSNDEIDYIIHHVFLPPELPHRDNYSVEKEATLLKIVIQGLSAFKDRMQDGPTHGVNAAITTMKHLRLIHDSSMGIAGADEGTFVEAFEMLSQKGQLLFYFR